MINWSIDKIKGEIADAVGKTAKAHYEKIILKAKREVYRAVLSAFFMAMSVIFLLVGIALLLARFIPLEYSLISVGLALLMASLIVFKRR